jgi:hypothetical protein
MTRSSTFVPFKTSSRHTPTTKGVADFLRGHDKMASLLPSIMRMAALQRDCAAALPTMFSSCGVLQFDAAQLVLSTPNAALASKLKQQLPKLTAALQQRGWQVSAIRLKVQVGTPADNLRPNKKLSLPDQAISALAELETTLEPTPRNAGLLDAINRLVRRPRR